MESKEKAMELFDKYYFLLTYFSENSSIDSRRRYAKDFALIAVDEILEALDSETIIYGSEYRFEENKFWNEVLRQIEKL
jgi:hypothetical protein